VPDRKSPIFSSWENFLIYREVKSLIAQRRKVLPNPGKIEELAVSAEKKISR
jgi:hypothetical protein